MDVAAGGVRGGAYPFVRLRRESGEFRLREALVLDVDLHGESKSTALARSDADFAGNGGLPRSLVILFSDEVECPAEAGRVAGGEEMFGSGGVRLPGPPIAIGTERSALTEPSDASVCPFLPPEAVAIAVKSG